jgi:drug/metabolite transporter (DMT)-like permease
VIKQILSKPFLAIAWIIMIQVLLCLPGSTLPSGGVFEIPQLDKIVHISLFGGGTAIWCYFYYLKGTPANKLKTIFFIIYLLVSANGIILEFIQRDYIPNRSFDLADIIADMIGASVAYGICNIRLLKTTG